MGFKAPKTCVKNWNGRKKIQKKTSYNYTARSLTASLPLKNGGSKTILSYWEGNFSVAILNFGRVTIWNHQPGFLTSKKLH